MLNIVNDANNKTNKRYWTIFLILISFWNSYKVKADMKKITNEKKIKLRYAEPNIRLAYNKPVIDLSTIFDM